MIFSLGSIDFYSETSATERPHAAISACLQGQPVRYDGTDKLLETTSTILSKYLQLISICPEVGAGLGTPRPPVQIVKTRQGVSALVKVLGRDDKTLDVTAALDHFRHQSLHQYRSTLSGYILKSRSPSCGLGTTPLFNQDGSQSGIGSGVQADYFRRQLPWLVMVDEASLADARGCEDFIVRCQLLCDIRSNATPHNCQALQQHYQSLISTMPGDIQAQLRQAIIKQDTALYWQQFGVGLNNLV